MLLHDRYALPVHSLVVLREAKRYHQEEVCLMSELSALGRDVQMIRTQQAQQLLLRVGRWRFGAPLGVHLWTVEELTDLERLRRWFDRLFDADCWDDILETP